ncbi:hypothetical protein A3A76_05415 [Candidatus Woesebacteria bacterium RIFCSPLOWO2_01_FULL_39_23]|uniref:Regulatory protein RecX n=2 Tax=Microgenomates group TaxID=1794810 RepID=A0A0H4T3W1_9BACT|nr:hypothetical protein [uncultured Microgenomates bacterium Rifle_16ft_4_minimus_37633]OGM13917.1 MAG: hypothetical protein A2141_04640 [Candidatus Woesebacteria bacterium RBG_16_40_11]OGM27870.1 MAG: hypothetical protein A2628_05635 [Candidatus Woesebacteria bacterium RIFCSPHIGHO2_01_FULL_40_22]OGM36331.1 MAG: hypothetical protein A3E41_02835 [Candidatus Woesebacteria bacterium RIFCSPHIGHO2_12_FULL_38_9]OGM62292.1 MAG: hypothetical protein A3A76_05415 [Candidatus Woesebacteria bacterium RIFCS
MSTITQIKPQKNNKRVNIYLDGKFGFGLDLESLMTLSLKAGTELTEDKIQEIVKKAEFQKTLDKLLKFATLRPRSEKEIRDWFRRKKVHESLTPKLFERLTRIDLVDDKKFAEWWVGQRLQFKFKSKRDLENELRMKGVNRDIVSQVISELVSQEDEVRMAKELLEKRKYRWERLPRLEAEKKMSEYLARKGFNWEIIRKLVKVHDDY